MKYAVVRHGGKQYRVIEGETIQFDFLPDLKPQDVYEFRDVLLLIDGEHKHVGIPTVAGAKVKGTIINSQLKGKKLRVSKFKAKVRYRRVRGFRPLYTTIKIDSIITNDKD